MSSRNDLGTSSFSASSPSSSTASTGSTSSGSSREFSQKRNWPWPQASPGKSGSRVVRKDRKSVVSGKSVSVSVDLGGSRIIKKKKARDYTEINRSKENKNDRV